MIYSFAAVVGQTIPLGPTDQLDFDAAQSAGDLRITYDGTDTIVDLNGQTVRLSQVAPSQLSSANFLFPGGGGVLISATDGHSLTGSTAPDFIYLSDAAADLVNAGDGNDRIVLGAGSSLDGSDQISGGFGQDELIVEGSGTFDTSPLTAIEKMSIQAGTTVAITLADQTAASATIAFAIDSRQQVQGDQTIVDASAVSARGISVLAGAGDDSLTGSTQADILSGGDGADTISGGAGDDVIEGGLGQDVLTGNAGVDTFRFGPGIPRSESYPGGADRITDFEGLGILGGDRIDLPQIANGIPLAFNATAQAIPGFDIPADMSVPSLAGDGLADLVWSQNATTFETRIWVDVDDDGQLSEPDILITLDGTGPAQVTAEDFAQPFLATKLTDGDDIYPGATHDNSGPNLIYALAGNDSVDAGNGDDTVIAADGNDTVLGGDGFDNLDGGDGDDSLSGGLGNDVIQAGTGSDTIDGGDGHDYIAVASGIGDAPGTFNLAHGGLGNDTIQGGAGGDSLAGDQGQDQLEGADGSDTLDGGDGHDVVFGGEGADTLDGGLGNDTLSGGNGADLLTGGAGADVYLFSHSATDSTLPDRDTIAGFSQAEGDKIDISTVGRIGGVFGNAPVAFIDVPPPVGFTGQPGDRIDDVYGIGPEITQLRYAYTPGKGFLFADINHNGELDSEDFLVEFTGPSIPTSLTAADFVPGTFKVIVGTGGDDLLNGGAGDDTIYGVGGNDTINGGVGWDWLKGGDGDDTIDGGLDSDTLEGGTGNDSLSGGDAGDTVDGGEGSDTIDGGAGHDSLHTGGDLAGSGSANLILGGDGNDQIRGEGGDDTLQGDAGDDVISDSAGANLLDGGSGDDWVSGGIDSDTILGGSGFDTLTGGDGADLLTGGLDGDIFTYSPFTPAAASSLAAMDTITDFDAAAGDRIDLGTVGTLFGAFGGQTARFQGSLGQVAGVTAGLILGSDPDGFVRIHSASVGPDTYLIADLDRDGILGEADFVVKFTGLGRAIQLSDFVVGSFAVRVGTDAAETLVGTPGSDTIFGAGGDDLIDGQDLADFLDGGSGNDTIDGGLDSDTIAGGTGNDSLSGGDAGDTVNGGEGSDTIDGGAGDDLLYTGGDLAGSGSANLILGGDGNDQVAGEGGDDTLQGDAGDDVISDSAGANLLDGGSGDDRVSGGIDSDTILGGSGFDTLTGGDGADVLTGGLDGDIFTYSPFTPATQSSLAAMDTITDFDAAAGDRIDLGTVGTLFGAFGGAPLVFGGALGPVAALGGLVLPAQPTGFTWLYSARIGTDTYLVVDLDGDAVVSTSDFVVRLAGLNRDLDLGDFIDGTFKAKVGTLGDDAAAHFTPTGEAEIFFGLGGNDTIDGLDGGDYIDAGQGNDVADGGLGFDTVYGGDGNDLVLGNDGADTLDGGAGSDTIYGGNEGDQIAAGAEDGTAGSINEVYGGFGNDYISGDGSADLLFGDEDDDQVFAGGGLDTLYGGTGSDGLYGDDGDDSIDGGAGDDRITGGQGADTLSGGTEADIFAYNPFVPANESSLSGFDTILDFSGAENDRIDLGTAFTFIGAFGAAPIRFEADLGQQTAISAGMALPDGSNTGTQASRLFVAQVGADAYVIVDLDGDGLLGNGDFVVRLANLGRALTQADFVDGTFAVQVGTGGNDGAGFFQTTLGDDRMLGLGGDDTLDGDDGADLLYGGAGNDSVSGGSGFDILSGDDGNDLLDGGDGGDTIDGGEGADTIDGGDGNDLLSAGNDQNGASNTIYGNLGDDLIYGGEGGDLLDGGLDDDQISGAGGNDTILGQFGSDTLSGGEGHDLLLGGTLSDMLCGGAGNDTLDGGSEDDTIEGGQGIDLVILQGNRADYALSGTAAALTATRIAGTSETDLLQNIEAIQFADGTFTLAQLGFGTANTAPSVSGPVDLGGLAEDTARLITAAELLGGATDADNDPLSVTNLTASSGTLVDNGDGTWTFTPDSNDDTSVSFSYQISDGQASISQTATLDLAPENDAPLAGPPVILAPSAEDTGLLITAAMLLSGASDADNDTLSVQSLTASSGTLIDNGDGTWSFTPAADDDTGVTFSYFVSDGQVTVAQTATLDLTAVNDAPVGSPDSATTGRDTPLTLAAAALLGNDSDVDNAPGALSIGAVQNGTGGTVTLNPDGSVTFTPSSGFSGTASFFYRPTDGTDLGALTQVSVTVTSPGIVLNGTGAADTLTGGIGDDTLSGAGGNDVLDGGDGNDRLTGGTGNDTLSGGDGDDTFVFGAGSNGFDAVDGGLGTNDRIVAAASGVTIGLASLAGVEVIDGGGLANVRLAGSTAANLLDLSSVTLVGISAIDAGSGNDTVIGSDGADTIIAGSGNDVLSGGEGDDLFLVGASAGIDTITGGGGTDTVRAGAANVSVTVTAATLADVEIFDGGGFANFRLVGTSAANALDFSAVTLTGVAAIDAGSGNDTVFGSSGDDTIVAGRGNDALSGGGGDDLFLVGASAGLDTINGGSGNDVIRASAANVSMSVGTNSLSEVETIDSGGFANFRLVGTSAGDALDFSQIALIGVAPISGGNGNDTITGSAGDDVIEGGAGRDLLTGGLGDDMFDFNVASHSRGTTVDVIADFVIGSDIVDLSTIDADGTLGTRDSFLFLGSSAFSGAAGELRVDTTTIAGVTRIFADLDGNRSVDMEIQLVGTHTLTQTDFLL